MPYVVPHIDARCVGVVDGQRIMRGTITLEIFGDDDDRSGEFTPPILPDPHGGNANVPPPQLLREVVGG